MKNAHLMSENHTGIELFEFVEPKMPQNNKGEYSAAAYGIHGKGSHTA
jgi:hypothetical protein